MAKNPEETANHSTNFQAASHIWSLLISHRHFHHSTNHLLLFKWQIKLRSVLICGTFFHHFPNCCFQFLQKWLLNVPHSSLETKFKSHHSPLAETHHHLTRFRTQTHHIRAFNSRSLRRLPARGPICRWTSTQLLGEKCFYTLEAPCRVLTFHPVLEPSSWTPPHTWTNHTSHQSEEMHGTNLNQPHVWYTTSGALKL